jgi:hypothetical protein
MVKNNVDSWWDKIKQKNLSADPKSQELMEEFRNREKLSVIVEKYDDHRLKAYRFVTSPHAIVVIHPDPIKADALAYTSVYDPYYMRHYLDKEYNKKNPFSPTHTHEPLHTFDIALCYNKTFGKQIAQPSMNFPCGNEDQIDEAIPDRLAKALKIDNERYSNFLKQISKSGKEIPEDIIAKNHYQNIGDENFKRIGKAYEKVSQVISGEIIPCFTDFVRNPQFLIGFAPNIAVMRSYVISVRDAENQPYVEAQFYSAVMQCDAGKVKEMIKKDPAILDKTYDGIVLNQLPKLLAANHYDKYVNEDFRKDGKNNKSNYAAINGIVKAAYDKYQKENKQRLEVVGQRAFNPHDNREL